MRDEQNARPSLWKRNQDKLFIQTLGADGLRFKLRGGDWIKLDPIMNPDYKDYEGAGDFFRSQLPESDYQQWKRSGTSP